MGRNLTEDGNCFRTGLTYQKLVNNTWEEYTEYYGPYDTIGKAKAMRTTSMKYYILNRDGSVKKNIIIIRKFEQVTEKWIDI
jgi:hypothetical protein